LPFINGLLLTEHFLFNLKRFSMKNTKIAVIGSFVIALAISAFTFKQQTSSIKGTVTPADKATTAWAIPTSSSDSVSAPVNNGSFEIQNLKAGDYTVRIVAQAPYGNAEKTGVTVEDGKTTDVGEITLQEQQ
jgi:6-phosphogluconate dehydrogenase (decarboxylating)